MGKKRMISKIDNDKEFYESNNAITTNEIANTSKCTNSNMYG